jgi:hypothetical protein
MATPLQNYTSNAAVLHIIRFLLDAGYLSKRTRFNMEENNKHAMMYSLKAIADDFKLKHANVFGYIKIRGRKKAIIEIKINTDSSDYNTTNIIRGYAALPEKLKESFLIDNPGFLNFHKYYNRFVKIRESNIFGGFPRFSYRYTLVAYDYNHSNPFEVSMAFVNFLKFIILSKEICNQFSPSSLSALSLE